MPRPFRSPTLLAVAAVASLSGLSAWSYHDVVSAQEAQVEEQLRVQLDFRAATILRQVEEAQRFVEIAAQIPEVRAAIRRHAQGQESDEALLAVLESHLQPSAEGFFSHVLYFDSAGVIGRAPAEQIEGAWDALQHTTFARTGAWTSLPVHLGDGHFGQYAFARVMSEGRESFLALVFAEDHTTSRLMGDGRFGQTGETYLLDVNGCMLSPSRFVPVLKEAERCAPTLLKQQLSARSPSAALTLDPYPDYRGIPVVGAWQWLPERGIGIAAEIDAEEALLPIRQVQLVLVMLIGLLGALFVAAAVLWRRSQESYAQLERQASALQWQATALEQQAQQLSHARDEALAASRAKSAFLANTSHEIRTPMNGVLGMLTLLQQTQLTLEQADYARTALQAGQALLGILNDILDLSKIEAGRLKTERIPFSLRAVIDAAAQVVQLAARQKGLDFHVEIAPDIPPGLEGDPARLQQVLLNLLSNAIKFTERGGVRLRAWREGERVFFLVEDTGIGIAPSRLDHLFSPFTQADDSTTRKYGGTGLGLSICKQLVELMDGAIGMESEEGRGTTVRFHLPCREITLPQALRAQGNVGAVSASNRRLLLVEDNPVNQKVARKMLQKLGYHVDVVDNGKKALALISTLEQPVYALILMDCQMPEMDGFTATRHIRQLPTPLARTVIVALTANAMASDREACLQAGMDDFIPKPFSLEQLEETLRRWLGEQARAAS